MSGERTPTTEQAAIIAAYRRGENLVVNAYAGSGKTTILKMLAGASPDRKFLYVAYNKAAQLDARSSFPVNTRCYTSHGLAYQPMITMAKRVGGGRYMPGHQLAKLMRIIGPQRLTDSRVLSPAQLASVVKATIRRFCYSADEEIGGQHVPHDMKRFTDPEEIEVLRQVVPPIARRVWEKDITAAAGLIPMDFDYFLKAYALTHPRLPGDVIALDEAQDSNPCVAAMVREQIAYGTQVVMVGDTYQAIYEWRGARDAMAGFAREPGVTVLSLTQCQPAGTMVRIPVQGSNGKPGNQPMTWREVPIETVREGDLVVSWTRRRGARKGGRRVTSIATRQHDGPLVVAQVGDTMSRYAANHECIVVLGDRLADGDHVVYLQRRNGQYRIGRCPWRYGNGVAPIRRAVREQADAMWVLSVHQTESDAALAEALACVQFGIPGIGWVQDDHCKMSLAAFWEKIGDNRVQAENCLSRHGLLIDYPLWKPASAEKPGGGWGTLVVTAAANLRSGMLMWRADAAGITNGSAQGYTPWSAWTPITISPEWYTGTIYSLSVDVDHTYIADGIATHNSFRFGPSIAAEGNKWLTVLGAAEPLRGYDGIQSRVGQVAMHPDAVLCRTNAEVLKRAIAAIGQGLKVAFPKGTGELVALTKAARDLKLGRPCDHPDLMAFENWGQVQDFVDSDPDGEDLKQFVSLVDEHGVDGLFAILSQIGSEEKGAEADITISTAHSAKGREWRTVEIAGDFREPKRDPEAPLGQLPKIPADLARLAYVAVTRGMYVLDRAGLAWVDHYLDGPLAVPAGGSGE